MLPTFTSGQKLMTTRVFSRSDIHRGTVIVFYQKEQKMNCIKRVAGLPGDTVLIRDGVLYINGQPESGGYEKMEDPGIARAPVTLQKDEYFVLGDNRNNSWDSRKTGPIKYGDIISIIKDSRVAMRPGQDTEEG